MEGDSRRERTLAILRAVPPLALVGDEGIEALIGETAMERRGVGEVVFREGDPPGDFYIVHSGRARAVAVSATGVETTLATLGPGDHFGEVSALRGVPRSATIRIAEDATLLVIPAGAFRRVIELRPEVRTSFDRYLAVYGIREFLKKCTVFGVVPSPILNEILSRFRIQEVSAGDVIVREGEPSDAFFVIERGTFEVIEEGRPVNTLVEGESFGEIGLLGGVPRSATVTAMSQGRLLALDREDFERVCRGAPSFRENLARAISAYNPALGLINPPVPLGADGAEPESPPAEAAPPEARPPGAEGAAPAPRRGWRRPFVAQHDETDCGAACLGMVARHFGVKPSLSRLRVLANVTTEGASLAGLTVAAEALGFSTRAIRTSAARLRDLDLPAICHWRGMHFVVLWEIRGKHAVIGDPAIGTRKVPIEEFEKSWTGHVLLLRATEALRPPPASLTALKRFLPLLKDYRLFLFEVFLCSLLLDLFGLAQPLFTQVVVDKVFVHGSVGLLNAMLVGMVSVALLQAVTTSLRRLLLVHISTRIDLRLITDFLRHLMGLPVSYFEARKVGDVMARVDENESITRAFVGTIPTALLDMHMAVIYIALLSLYSVKLTLLVLVFVVPFAALTIGFTPIIRANRRELFSRHAASSSFLIENVSGIHTVKAMGVETPMRWKWEGLFHRVILETRRGAHIDIVQETLAHLLSTVTGVFIFWYGAHLVLDGQLTLGQLFAFQVLVGHVMTPLLGLVGVWDQIQALRISLDRLNDVFDAEAEEKMTRARLVPRVRGHIRFEDVTFRYPAARDPRPVLNRVAFEVPAGATCALVGRSGAGKSTISRLLLRFYDPQEGRITVDGHDTRTLSITPLRKQIGVVPQEVVLFSGTIHENIALGDPDIPLERIAAAAQMAGAHDFISSFPLGYDTPVGERGVTLSGGQRQRVAIARAILHDPAVLIFDEATSALDTESERAIQRNLETLCRGRTTFVIAHRLSTVQNADLIVVLDQGGVAESGSHRELMGRRGLYSYLVTQQLPT